MSAIWGAVDLNGDAIDDKVKDIMRKSFDKCVIDRYEQQGCDNVYMGCGVQYFTDTAKNETLPIFKSEKYYTADVILDNKDFLCDKLGTKNDEKEKIPDGKVLFDIYEKYGKKCLDDLIGAYTFAWYDKNKNELELVIDAVGNRCLYYMKEGSIVYFSSLLEPLKLIKSNCKLNDRWLTDFLAMDHLFMINEAEETPIQGIFRIAPAQYIRINQNGINKKTYWDPFKRKEQFKFSSDEEYKDKFCKIWDSAVKDVLRSEKDISILLSGGLDSTSVAAVAAPYLKEQGRKLYSYTSVPVKSFTANNDGYYIQDETEDVLKTAQYFGNIETEFIDLDGKVPYELMQDEMDILEIPFKSIQNCLWICDAMRKAYKKGSRVMLTGSYGNTTISYTDLNVYMNTLYKNKQFRHLKHELKTFASNMGFNYSYALNMIKKQSEDKYESDAFIYKTSLVKRNIADVTGSKKRIEKMQEEEFYNGQDFTLFHKCMFNLLSLRQSGEIATKHSLATGVVFRDPTKDKRIIEFCINIPMEQFCKEGTDRRLVKVYLKDIIPPHVIRFQKQGQQSADLKHRFVSNWDSIRNEWISEFEKHSNSKYVNVNYAIRWLEENKNIDNYSSFDLTRFMYTLLVLRYEDTFANYKTDCVNTIHKNKIKVVSPLISIVVLPGKDDSKTIDSINSAIKQTYDNIEILVIDNHSGSSDTLKDYSKSDKRIHILSTSSKYDNNLVLEYAVDNAKGDYISFLNPGYIVHKRMYEKLTGLITEQNANISICDYASKEPENLRKNIYLLGKEELMAGFAVDSQYVNIPDKLSCYLFERKYVIDNKKELFCENIERVNIKAFLKVKNAVYTTAKCCYKAVDIQQSCNYVKNYIIDCRNDEKVIRGCLTKTILKDYLNGYLKKLLVMYKQTDKSAEKTKCQRLLVAEIKRVSKVLSQSGGKSSDKSIKNKVKSFLCRYMPKVYLSISVK